MDTKPIRELIEAAREMEAWNGPGTAESLGAKCETLNEAESHLHSAIAAAERALADAEFKHNARGEIIGSPEFAAALKETTETFEALRLADELSAEVLGSKQNVGNPMKGKARAYRKKRGLGE